MTAAALVRELARDVPTFVLVRIARAKGLDAAATLKLLAAASQGRATGPRSRELFGEIP